MGTKYSSLYTPSVRTTCNSGANAIVKRRCHGWNARCKLMMSNCYNPRVFVARVYKHREGGQNWIELDLLMSISEGEIFIVPIGHVIMFVRINNDTMRSELFTLRMQNLDAKLLIAVTDFILRYTYILCYLWGELQKAIAPKNTSELNMYNA